MGKNNWLGLALLGGALMVLADSKLSAGSPAIPVAATPAPGPVAPYTSYPEDPFAGLPAIDPIWIPAPPPPVLDPISKVLPVFTTPPVPVVIPVDPYDVDMVAVIKEIEKIAPPAPPAPKDPYDIDLTKIIEGFDPNFKYVTYR